MGIIIKRAVMRISTMIVAGMLVLLVLGLGGCQAPQPTAGQAPSIASTPTVTTGDNAKIMQTLETIQQSFQRVVTTNNNALDAERAKLEAKAQRIQQQDRASSSMQTLAVLLLFAMCDALLPKASRWRSGLLLLSALLFALSFGVPLLAALV